jgi:hypothetical protein
LRRKLIGEAALRQSQGFLDEWANAAPNEAQTQTTISAVSEAAKQGSTKKQRPLRTIHLSAYHFFQIGRCGKSGREW